jgi:hypothetical protein
VCGLSFSFLTADDVEGAVGDQWHNVDGPRLIFHLVLDDIHQYGCVVRENGNKLFQDLEVECWGQHLTPRVPFRAFIDVISKK